MLVALIFLAFCSLGASQTTIGTGIANFGLEFYKECVQEHPGDIIISPLSVSSLLILLSQAANGTTFEQLQSHLFPNIEKAFVGSQYHNLFEHLQKNGQDSPISMVNQIYVEKESEVNPSFSKIANEQFMSGVEQLNFAEPAESAQTINNFVKSKTHDKITEIIKSSDLNSDTEMVLLNVIYFKSNWEHQFQKNLTKKDNFHIRPNQTIQVDFMHTKGRFGYIYWEAKRAAILEMKFSNSSYSFVAILPDKGVNLSSIETQLESEQLYSLMMNDLFDTNVEVTIPKFSVEYEVDLKKVLEKLNMGEMFKLKSDLSGLLKKDKELKVSKAIHKAVFDMNEDGAEASASTAIGIEERSGFGAETFIANRPFMYFIRDTERNVIVCFGHLDVERTLTSLSRNHHSDVFLHLRDNPDHFLLAPEVLKAFHRRKDVLCAPYVITHVQKDW